MRPVVCDMSNAPDTPEERLAEYRQLFAASLLARERTDTGIRFRFRADAHDAVQALAAKEKQCCAFFDFVVRVDGDGVIWDVSVDDAPAARAVLDAFYEIDQLDQIDSSSALGGSSPRVNVTQ